MSKGHIIEALEGYTVYECGCTASSRTNDPRIRLCPLHAAAPRMRGLLQKVAAHFEGTDSPLGQEARTLLAEIEGKEAP